jgi:hypothetical protein
MTTTTIPDDELLASADMATVWVATPDAPADVWSLSEAIAWTMQQPNRDRITLFRAPAKDLRAVWLKPDQIERLAHALLPEFDPATT